MQRVRARSARSCIARERRRASTTRSPHALQRLHSGRRRTRLGNARATVVRVNISGPLVVVDRRKRQLSVTRVRACDVHTRFERVSLALSGYWLVICGQLTRRIGWRDAMLRPGPSPARPKACGQQKRAAPMGSALAESTICADVQRIDLTARDPSAKPARDVIRVHVAARTPSSSLAGIFTLSL